MYDVIIIGSGPGGMSAATYTTRAELKTLVLEKSAPGGAILNTAEVENYIGVGLISGPELAMNMYSQMVKLGAELKMEEVTSVEFNDEIKVVKTSAGNEYQAKAVIIATGAAPRTLDIPGEQEFAGRGVSYCLTCDGAFFKDKVISVIGGGNTALEEAMYATNFGSKVYLIHRRDEFRGNESLQTRVKANEKIEIIYNAKPVAITGESNVEHLELEDVNTGEKTIIDVDAVFPMVGRTPNTLAFNNVVDTQNNFVLVNEHKQTSIKGVYAIGDVSNTPLRQIATAVGDGAIAAEKAKEYINE